MKIKQTLLIFVLLVGVGGSLFSPVVSAKESANDCDGVSVSIIPCNSVCPDGKPPTGGKCSDGSKPSAIWGILLLVINILTAGIGVAAVGGVIYGSILYTTAGGSMEDTKRAKVIIFNVAIGLVAYALMFSILNFIIPGGLFN